MIAGLVTVADFEIWANTQRIPMLLDIMEAELAVNLFYFYRDRDRVCEYLDRYLPVHIHVNHFIVGEGVGYSQKVLIGHHDCLKKGSQ